MVKQRNVHGGYKQRTEFLLVLVNAVLALSQVKKVATEDLRFAAEVALGMFYTGKK